MRFYFYFILFYVFFALNLPHQHPAQIINVPAKSQYLEQVKVFSKVTYFPYLIGLIIRFNRTQPGEYRIPSMSSFLALLRALKGRVLYRIFIPEGASSREILNILNKAEFLSGEIEAMPADGALMASTYLVTSNTRRQCVIKIMKNYAIKQHEALWKTRPADYPLTREQWIVLASLLEKEGLDLVDKQKICGVIMNRLQKKMRLQIDATVLYIKTDGLYSEKINWEDLKRKNHRSDYNTYAHSGLPPGPISNPGVESLKAALNPIKHNFLYYRIYNGGHVFSESFEKHKACQCKSPLACQNVLNRKD